jgi:hypothetical protein
MSAALTITHQIAAPLEVINAELGLLAQNQATAMRVLEIVDAGSFEVGNRLLIDSHKSLKELEAARVKLKKPITDLGKAIDAVVAKVADPLDAAKRSLQGKVLAYQRQEQERAERDRREAEAKAAAERAAAEAERARLQAIADAEHAKQVAEAKAQADAEAAELAKILGEPVAPEPVAVAPAPVVEVAKPAPAPVIPAAPKASAVQVRRVPVRTCTDPAALAAWLCANGRASLIDFDMVAIGEIQAAGVTVPGFAIEYREVMAAGRGA